MPNSHQGLLAAFAGHLFVPLGPFLPLSLGIFSLATHFFLTLPTVPSPRAPYPHLLPIPSPAVPTEGLPDSPLGIIGLCVSGLIASSAPLGRWVLCVPVPPDPFLWGQGDDSAGPAPPWVLTFRKGGVDGGEDMARCWRKPRLETEGAFIRSVKIQEKTWGK